MTVHFIGAGPGAPDLITVRGLGLIRRCPVILYAGSLVPAEVVAEAPDGARVLDTAPMTLDQIVAEMAVAAARGQDVARVHSGDLSLYSAVAEQARRLDGLGIAWTMTPGVPAFAAAAAALRAELTLPELTQTIVLTRTAVRASAMPEGESLAAFARTGATLAIHLAITNLAAIVRELVPILGDAAPAAVVHRASWPDELVIQGTLGTIRAAVKAAGITRTALILIGPALGSRHHATARVESRLYAPDHHHVLRPPRRSPPSTPPDRSSGAGSS